jgi:nicotinamidase-related amidase
VASLLLDPDRTALVVIDLQEGIIGMPTAPHPADEVVRKAAALADACRQAGVFVVLVHVDALLDGRDALRPETDAGSWAGGPRPATWARIVAELGPRSGDHVVTKHQWGAFYGTDLDLQLRRRGIDTILLTGISTNAGVESTARDAYERGYRQVFVVDAMAARSAEEHEHTVQRVFPRIGLVRTAEEVIGALAPAD